MATMSERIRTLRSQAGISQGKFGEIFGVTREAVSQWEAGKSRPDQQKLEAMATRYGVTLDWLAGKGPEITKPQGDGRSGEINQRGVEFESKPGLDFSQGARMHTSWPKDLKILGHVRAGVEGFFLEQGEHHGMAYRPPALSTVRDAFAVYVHDDCMSPKYEPGEIVWIHPTRPVAPGNHVIIELTDGQAFIKKLVRRTAKEVICEQYNPREPVKFDVRKVKRLYYVVGSYRED